jgi:hypothetical protein
MGIETKDDEGKKKYESPRLAEISLRPEEAVLGACKSLSGGKGALTTCTAIPFCQNFGS